MLASQSLSAQYDDALYMQFTRQTTLQETRTLIGWLKFNGAFNTKLGYTVQMYHTFRLIIYHKN